MKTQIYAPRLVGDIDLGLEPSRLGGDDAKQWARMTFPGIQLPGLVDQHIYETSSTPKFAIGTRRIEYGRTFRYAQAAETTHSVSNANLLGNGNFCGDNTGKVNEDDYFGDLVAGVSAGEKYLDIEQKAMAERLANYFQGGYVTVFDSNYNTYYVVASDASAPVGAATYTRIYLDHITVQAISATNGVEIHRSPYSKVIDGESEQSWKSFVGRALCGEITINHYFWLQTAGPAWVKCSAWDSNACPGYSVNNRDVYAAIDGALKSAIACDPSEGYQRVGYLLPATTGGVAYASGSAFIMLQLE